MLPEWVPDDKFLFLQWGKRWSFRWPISSLFFLGKIDRKFATKNPRHFSLPKFQNFITLNFWDRSRLRFEAIRFGNSQELVGPLHVENSAKMKFLKFAHRRSHSWARHPRRHSGLSGIVSCDSALIRIPRIQKLKFHAQYDWTTGVREWRKLRAAPRSHPLRPLVCTLFNRGANRRAFRLPGEGGDHCHCTVKPCNDFEKNGRLKIIFRSYM